MGKKTENEKKQDDDVKIPKQSPEKTTLLNGALTCHCYGCVKKIRELVSKTKGVRDYSIDKEKGLVTVKGIVDVKALTENLSLKLTRQVDLVSPPKKEEKKTLTVHAKLPETRVLKGALNCPCYGCVVKIRKLVSKTKGVHDFSIDNEKGLVTVKGIIDVKALTENLKLKRYVQFVTPKKEEKKEKDEKKKKDGGEEKRTGGSVVVAKKEGSKMAHEMQTGVGYGYQYPQAQMFEGNRMEYQMQTGYEYPIYLQAPQMFSEENPSACFIM